MPRRHTRSLTDTPRVGICVEASVGHREPGTIRWQAPIARALERSPSGRPTRLDTISKPSRKFVSMRPAEQPRATQR